MKKKWLVIIVLLVLGSTLLPAAVAARVEASNGAGSEMRVSISSQTGVARFVWPSHDQAVRIMQKAGTNTTAENQAEIFFREFGNLFGIVDFDHELELSKKITDAFGNTHLSYDQVYKNVPVFAGVLRIHFDARGMISSANGTFIPGIALDPFPALSAEFVANIAEKDVATLNAVPVNITLFVFRKNLARGNPGENYLVYEVEVSDDRNVHEFIYVNAHTGAIIDRISGVYELDREIYHQFYEPENLIWKEGDLIPFYSADLRPEINRDINRLIDFSEDTYQMAANATFGSYLSFDGNDATMIAVADDQTPDFCPNAMWNFRYTQFCEGITGDDTVAHEWGHAYTQYTNNLVYQWQPGAINEAYSDIYGEVVDFINGVGLDEPGGLRTDGICSVYTPFPVSLQVLSPESIAGIYAAGFASFGPRIDGTLQGSLMIVDDGTGTTATEGCEPLVNDLTGKIAFIRRGNCTFVEKVLNAQNAGAIGAIVANHLIGGDDTFTMAGDDPAITIQSLLIGYSDGNTIETELLGGTEVIVKFNVEIPAQLDDSYRWLSGEDDDGGAIRDLWNPTCYGDPDKVTSENFTCSTEDAGGVHTNSGVPNHAFALLVDGGSFNGQTITGIGLYKAFQLYWRANYLYQVPTSGYADHADSLLQSCQDLVGFNVPDLKTGSLSGQIITTNDCDEVAKVVAAVEMYEPTNCTRTTMPGYQYQIRLSR